MKLHYYVALLSVLFPGSISQAAGLPNELFGARIGENIDSLENVMDTNASNTLSFTPSNPDGRLGVYWATHDEERNITAIHAYQFEMLADDCLILRDSIVSESSNKYGIEFSLITRSTGTEYFGSESECMAIVVDCRNAGTRLRFALAIKRQN